MPERLTLRVRAAAVFPLAALAVHEAFYRVVPAPSGHAGRTHDYIPLLEPAAGVVAALVVAALVARLVRAWRYGEAREPGFCALRLWAAASLGLLAVFAVQESLEAVLSGVHPLALGHGGYVVVPLAAAAGALLTLFLRGARAAAVALARRGARPPAAVRQTVPPRRRPAAARPRLAPLALSAAGRAPPPVAVPE